MKNKRLLLINILITIAFIAVVYVGLSGQETTKIKESKPKKQEQAKELILDEQTFAPSHEYEYKKTEGSQVPSFTLELDPDAFTEVDVIVEEDVEEVSLSDDEIDTDEEVTEQYVQQLQEPTTGQEVEQGGNNYTPSSASSFTNRNERQSNGSTTNYNSKSSNGSNSNSRPKTYQPTNTPKKDEQPKKEPVKKNNFEPDRSKPLEEKKEDIKQKEESSNVQEDTNKIEESSDKGTSSTNTEE